MIELPVAVDPFGQVEDDARLERLQFGERRRNIRSEGNYRNPFVAGPQRVINVIFHARAIGYEAPRLVAFAVFRVYQHDDVAARFVMLAFWHRQIVTVRMTMQITPLICRSFQRTLIKTRCMCSSVRRSSDAYQKLPGGMNETRVTRMHRARVCRHDSGCK